MDFSFNDIWHYFDDAVRSVKPFLVAIGTIVSYVIFPDEAYVPAFFALLGTMLLDIITKYYMLSVTNGGYKKAVQTRAISSRKLWVGTSRKIVGHFVVVILCGLSVRVTMLTSVAVFLSTVAYSIMFLREAQSCVENMIDAGSRELEWLLFWLRKKETKVMESEDIIIPPPTLREEVNFDDRV